MAMGAKKPMVLATMLVIPMRVPAKLDAMSMWFTLTELNWNPFIPTVVHRRATTKGLLHFAK
jgi:hypothetical protein